MPLGIESNPNLDRDVSDLELSYSALAGACTEIIPQGGELNNMTVGKEGERDEK